jgi:hypothetical protein
MKKLRRMLWIVLAVCVLALFYSSRANLISRYDAAYWKDRYEHSQWQLGLSPRTLGDNGLYAYEGYQLTAGEDPTKYNAEIPPLGKYAIGFIVRLLGNGAWYGALSGLAVLGLLFVLSKKILRNSLYALIVTAWFACDPLFSSQWSTTMLDTLHLVCLLLFCIALADLGKQSRWRLVAAGAVLGLFSAVKYPILSVILAFTAGYFIWKKTKSLVWVGFFLLAAAATYTATFLRYFLLGHTPVDWVHLQKWMFSYYSHSKLSPNIGSIWTTLLFGQFQNLFTRQWQSSAEWSLAWPVITIVGVIVGLRILQSANRRRFLGFLAFSVLGISLFYSCMTFWTRYLTLIIPFLYIGTAWVVKSMKKKWILWAAVFGIIAVNSLTSWHILFPTPEAEVKQFIYDWEHGYFQDMYERFTEDRKRDVPRYTFHRTMQEYMKDGEIERIAIAIVSASWSSNTSPQYVTIRITYSTRNLGEFSQTTRMTIVNENGLWRIPWDNEYFIRGLADSASIQTTVIPARRGSIIDQNKQMLASDFQSFMIWITPENVDSSQEEAMLASLERIFGNPPYSAVNFYHRYMVDSQPDWHVPLAIIPKRLDDEALETLSSYPGITLTPAIGREEHSDINPNAGNVANTHFFECCSLLYSTTTYDGIGGLEQTYNTRLKGENGGTLKIVNSTGSVIRTLIQKDVKNGEDISL